MDGGVVVHPLGWGEGGGLKHHDDVPILELPHPLES